MANRPGYPVWPIALAAGIWPIFIVHAAWVLSSLSGAIALSYPPLDGAYSVSAVARQLPTLYWFRIAIMPYGLLLLLFWCVHGRWLIDAGGVSAKRAGAIALCGMLGAAFMVLYAGFLGTEGEFYAWLRRFGATLLFALTALAQLCSLPALKRMQKQSNRMAVVSARLAMGCSLTLLALGLASLPLPLWLADPDNWQNRVEWWFGAVMMSWFVALAPCWRATQLSVVVVSRRAPTRR